MSDGTQWPGSGRQGHSLPQAFLPACWDSSPAHPLGAPLGKRTSWHDLAQNLHGQSTGLAGLVEGSMGLTARG